MTKILRFIRTHWILCCTALLIGICSSLPQYLATTYVPNFQGIYRGVANDMLYYEVRSKDILDGHSFLTNPYIAEHKVGLPMQFWLPDYSMAQPIGWLHISVPVGFIWWTFFLTVVLALLSYGILHLLTKRRDWSILGTIFLNIILFGGNFLRLPSPAFNFVFWLGTLLCLLLFIQTKKNQYAVLTSIFFGMLFHLYPYFWTFYVVLFFVFLAICRILKLNIPYKKYLYICVGAFVIGIPYFVSSWQSSQLSTYGELLRRVGVISTHFPSGFESVCIAAVVSLIYGIAYKKGIVQKDETNVLMFAGLLTAIIVVNQHVLTGSNAEFSSHYLLPDVFWASLTCIFLCKKWFDAHSPSVHKSLVFAFVIVLVLWGVISLRGIVEQEMAYAPADVYAQHYVPIFDWLNIHTPPESVVYANDDVESYLSIYTSDNVYYSPNALFFFMSNTEVQDRFIINHYFNTVTPAYVLEKQRMIFGAYYIDEYSHNLSKNSLRSLFGLPQVHYQFVPDAEINKIIVLANTIQKNDFEKELKTYKVDYIIWDTIKDPQWRIPSSFPLLYSSEGIFIYKVK